MGSVHQHLEPVDTFHKDVLNDGYRHCDFCFQSAADDIYDNKPWRKFYKATDGSGLNVCEHCCEEFANESTAPEDPAP